MASSSLTAEQSANLEKMISIINKLSIQGLRELVRQMQAHDNK